MSYDAVICPEEEELSSTAVLERIVGKISNVRNRQKIVIVTNANGNDSLL
jgi:hypothetical protein